MTFDPNLPDSRWIETDNIRDSGTQLQHLSNDIPQKSITQGKILHNISSMPQIFMK